MADSSAAAMVTVSQLLNSELSRNIETVLKDCQRRLATPSELIDVASFLNVALTNPTKRPGAQDILKSIFAMPVPARPASKGKVPAGEALLSEGLSAAFADAREIRSRTGGQDNFLGLRHVLFAILTSKLPATRMETDQAFERGGGNRSEAELKIVDYCDTQMESQEDRSVWNEILLERGLPPMGSDKGLTPAGSEGRKARQRHGLEVALLGSDDPWDKGAVDRSGAIAEADAFAAMISAREFIPPLAIGVFGEWGSGKSFFMRLVYDAVQANRSSDPAAPGPGTVTPLSNIVQIRFNAWHYAETNLWASLVDHIFTCLDRWAETANQQGKTDALFDRLATARRLTIESAEALVDTRRKRIDAEQRLDKAHADLLSTREALVKQPLTWAKTAFDALFPAEQPKAKSDLKAAAELLGLGDATTSAEALQQAGQKLDDSVAQYGIITSATLRQLALPFVVIVVTGLVLILPPVLAWLASLMGQMTGIYLPPIAAAVSGALAPIVAAIGVVTKKTQDAAAKVSAFHKQLNGQIDLLAREAKTEADAALKEVEAAAARVSQAEERLRLANEEAAQAATDYNLKNGKGRVLRFVRNRVENGDYAKHLGFIATVRKDFEELSVLMAPGEDADIADNARETHAAEVEQVLSRAAELLSEDEKQKLRASVEVPDATARVFERIVLYVDDLDRCPAKQVVEVLQALHMLLTFPLFVVVVAVDVRWVREALASQYPGQISGARNEVGRDLARASDYLEKIFQIPYWVRAMTADNTRALLDDRLGPETGSAIADAPATARLGASPGQTKVQANTGISPNPAAGATVPLRQQRSLQITSDERAFMMAVADVLDNSPRRTLRFVNSYRLIKASLDEEAVANLEAVGHRALLTLLAIGTCGGDSGSTFLTALCGGVVPPLSELTDSESIESVKIQQARVLFGPGSNDDLIAYAPLASRFSFDGRQQVIMS